MARYKFTPGVKEHWEALDRLEVDVPEHGWKLVEHLVAHAESSTDFPDALRIWLSRAYKKATAPAVSRREDYRSPRDRQLAVLLEALGLKRGAVGKPKVGIIEVGQYVHLQMWNGVRREQALREAAAKFKIHKRSVRNYLQKYEDALEVVRDE